MSRPFLEHVRVDHFGAWDHKTIGPLDPHLTVVFGRNEAGKTTFASFVGGVLFGWEEARGKNRNTYKPVDAERSGSLIFAFESEESDVDNEDPDAKAASDQPTAQNPETSSAALGEPAAPGDSAALGEPAAPGDSADSQGEPPAPAEPPVPDEHTASGEQTASDEHTASGEPPAKHLELRRVRNADGLQGDVFLTEDIDKDTYRTMFSLTSDELLSLNNAIDMTSHLLTAGSGTSASPAQVLARVDEQVSGYTSHAATADHSIVRLDEEIDETRRAKSEAEQQAQLYRAQNKELYELSPLRDDLNERMQTTSTAIERLSSCRASLKGIDAESANLEDTISRSRDEENQAHAAWLEREQACEGGLASITGAEDLVMRDKVDALSDREARQAHSLDAARAKFNEANAAYEALKEARQEREGGADGRKGSRRSSLHRTGRLVAVTIMFVLLLGLGIWLFIQGSAASSMSYTALGIVLVLVAAFLAVGTLVLTFRPSAREKAEDEEEKREEEARQAMVQAQKNLEACLADESELSEQIMSDLKEMGLGSAGSSLRRARTILDEAKDMRADIALNKQRQKTARERAEEAATRLAELEQQKASVREKAGVSDDVTIDDFDREIADLDQQRADLQVESEKINRRWGELTQELSQAQQMHDLDYLKNQYQALQVRRNDTVRDFARTLLARRMLNEAIAAWEARSQPEVYAQASRLLALMTDGRWVRIDMQPDGTLQVSDKAYGTCEVHKLSTSTCQQLYLSLRIALLMYADAVGRSIPIIADDILVHFDAQRRQGAARALAELARKRQVIMLTCHEEVVSVMRQALEDVTVIEL